MKIEVYYTIDEIKKCFGNENVKTIHHIDELLEFLQKEQEKAPGNVFYRGLNDGSYKLYSSSQVQYAQGVYRFLSYTDYLDKVWVNAQKRLTYIYDILNKQNNNNMPNNWISYFSIIQHFSTGTPLIDFSVDPYIGLFFAWYGAENYEPCCQASEYIQLNYFDMSVNESFNKVGLQNKAELKDLYNEFTQLNKPSDYFDNPNFTNALYFVDQNERCFDLYTMRELYNINIQNSRIARQAGVFILNFNSYEALEERMNTCASVCQLHKILIHKSLLLEIKLLLEQHLKTKEILLPESPIENVCKQIIKESQK